ncbi:MAG TPA: CDP-diacylglycerol--serine O-phosphatidyltransferase [Phycisphaerae bacterium]|nr:CDP-diacylglycerol--serine O-phosphatidyltransferase [Phycisphaerae bacterium]HPS52527.1 CDP-diacylglycerol--serine O-phosphatidyltransferase [Phycisphaerae bacterium]
MINEHRRHRRTIKTRMLKSTSVLPAMFTLCNGVAGFIAIHYATKQGVLGGSACLGEEAARNLCIAAWLMAVAMAFDMLDGRVARMTRTTSDFGAQLDSLCDMISFGAAPAIIMVRASVGILREEYYFLSLERLILCIAAVYVACAAIRLARFNVETDADESAHMSFSGLPSPGAAACVGATVLCFMRVIELHISWLPPKAVIVSMSFFLPVVTLCAALLMVSRIRYPHVVNQYLRGKKPLNYLIIIILLLVLFISLSIQVAMGIICVIFVLTPPLKALRHRLMQRQKKPANENIYA